MACPLSGGKVRCMSVASFGALSPGEQACAMAWLSGHSVPQRGR